MDRKEMIKKLTEIRDDGIFDYEKDDFLEFNLTEMQSAYLVGKKTAKSGCHTYTEYVVENLDVKKLEFSWNLLVKIHSILRIKILKNGKGYVCPYIEYKITENNTQTNLDQSYLEIFREKFTNKIYDMEDYPLYDIKVSRFNDKSVIHFLIDSWLIDGASIEILLKQWKNLYSDSNYKIVKPKTTFFSAITVIDKFKKSSDYKNHEKYWIEKNSKFENRPIFKINPNADSFQKKILNKVYSFEEYTKIKEFVSKNNLLLTPFLLGAFCKVLKHASQAQEFGIVCTHQNRPKDLEDINDIVGSFTTSTLFWVNKQDSFESLTEEFRFAQKQFLNDLEHKCVSGISSLKFTKDGYNQAPIPIVFTSRNAFKEENSFSKDETYFCTYTPQVYLEIHIVTSKNGLQIIWNYTKDAFENVNIGTLFQNYNNLIENVLEGKDNKHACDADCTVNEETQKLIPTPLQKSILFGRIMNPQKNIGIFYKSFSIKDLNIEKLKDVISQICNSEMAFYLNLDNSLSKFSFSDKINIPEIKFLNLENSNDKENKNTFVNKIKNNLSTNNFSAWVDIGVTKHPESIYEVHFFLDMVMFDGFSVQNFCNKVFEQYVQNSIIAQPINTNFPEYLKALEKNNHDIKKYEKNQFYWENKFKNQNIISKDISNIEYEYTYYDYSFNKYIDIKNIAKKFDVPVSLLISAIYKAVIKRWNFANKMNFVISDYIARKSAKKPIDCIGDFTNLSWISNKDNGYQSIKSILLDMKKDFYNDTLHLFGNPLTELFNNDNSQNLVPINAVFTNCLGASIEFLEKFKTEKTEAVSYGAAIDCVISSAKDKLLIEWMVLDSFISKSISTQMFTEFKLLLKLLVSNETVMERSIYNLNLGTSKEKRVFFSNNNNNLSKEFFKKIVYDFNRTDTTYNEKILIHKLFEIQTQNNPNAVALVTDTESITYEELNKKSNLLANQLKSKIEKQQLVAVYLTPSIELIVSLLAILKLGAVYVPININDPVERIKNIIETANIQLLLTDNVGDKTVSKIENLKLFNVNNINLNDQHFDNYLNLKDNICSEDLAYVIFTSGSTGIPKGVMVQHKPVVNLIEWAKKTFSFSSEDKVIFLNPINFDLSVFDIFGMLAYGASIRIVSSQDRHNPYKLLNIINNENITFWNTAPAYYQILSSILESKNVLNEKMKLFFLSGDWIPTDIFKKINKYFPLAKVIGLGGATEATVWSNYFEITDNSDYECMSIPYGKPMQNARYYILDDTLSPCNIGDRGNLFISGKCLSIGYLNNKKLTEKAFIHDPFHENNNMIMYNTGDVAKYMKDGNIEFLGRADSQVKIRGYRVEIGEIENALRKIDMKNPIVITKTDELNNKKLIAFGKLDGFQGVIKDSFIIEKINKILPEYMVPSEIYSIENIPLTSNGKVDNKKLLNIASANIQDSIKIKVNNKTLEKPIRDRFNTDKIVYDAINKILDRNENVDENTNLGHVGFSSLQYVLLGVKLSEKIQQEINPALFFKYSTPKEIISFLKKKFLKSEIEETKPINTLELRKTDNSNDRGNETDIAIIGVSCKLPGAENVDEFWSNLLAGKLFKQIIPKERWDSDLLKDTNVVYGNFIKGMKNFDSDFFAITPREAVSMDPRQRILMQSAWHALEDAGYSPERLRGSDTGFFVGSTGHDYEKIVFGNKSIDELSLMGISKTIIPNRVSYYYDWHGPSEVIDTACSSSLVAVHHAVKSIINKECSLALAGGINLIIDPEAHVSLDKIGMLAKDGISKTFDKQGDGYARGEGCILILLKPFNKAIEDNDNIYAVIKATAINHGGKANALTAPNMNAQIDVISKTYSQANINPEQIGYIETHGTGTALGDPIEVEAIKDAIEKIYNSNNLKHQHKIMLGAVKPNIGHLEAAAGIAGLLKLILVIKNKKFPPNIYPKILNPNIDLRNTALEINKELIPWATPASSKGHSLNRVGGVSSFGFGGVNVHVALEEHNSDIVSKEIHEKEYTFLLSAKSKFSLTELIKKYLFYLRKNQDISIVNMCYTLQIGRAHLKNRFAIVAHTIEDITKGLENYLNNLEEGFVIGNVNDDKIKIKYLGSISKINYKLLDTYTKTRMWSYGANVPWDIINSNKNFKKISLPLYPFVEKSYWIENNNKSINITKNESHKKINELTVSDKKNIEFLLTGKERFITEHIINGEKVLPGAAYVPYIQYACNLKTPFEIQNLTWLGLITEHMLPSKISISINEFVTSNDIEFFVNAEGKKHIFCCGKTEMLKRTENSVIRIAEIKKQLIPKYTKVDFYNLFSRNKIEYGPMFRGIEKVWIGSDCLLGKINFKSFSDQIDIPPTILDSSLQLVIFSKLLEEVNESWYPFSIERIKCFNALSNEGYIYLKKKISKNNIDKSDIFITDNKGTVLMEIQNCTGRKAQSNVHFFKKEWIAEKNANLEVLAPKNHFTSDNTITLILNSNNNSIDSTVNSKFYIKASISKDGIEIYETNVDEILGTQFLTSHVSENLKLKNKFVNKIVYFGTNSDLFDIHYISKFFYKTKEKIQIFIVDNLSDPITSARIHALIAWGKVLEKENSNFKFFYLKISNQDFSLNKISKQLEKIADFSSSHEFLLSNDGILFTKKILSLDPIKQTSFEIIRNAPYLITGGTGKIGQHIAKKISNAGAVPILVGRRAQNETINNIVENIKLATYYTCDVNNTADVQKLIKLISDKFGILKGVFHCAGINNDKFMYSKNIEDIKNVVTPKVEGVLNVDEATKDHDLDFFIMFSSLSSTLCSIGQTDYAYANMFMDNFSEVRNKFVGEKLRKGRTLSISWPFIKNSGMHMDTAILEKMISETGIQELDIADISTFLLNKYNEDHISIIPGNKNKILDYLKNNN